MFEAVVEEGLVLRLLEPRHAEALLGVIDRNRNGLGHWFPWAELTKTTEDSRAFICESLSEFAREGVFQLGIWLKGELAGVIGLQNVSQFFRSAEIYYWLGADYQGQGVVTKVS